jgi:hypothetical protein
MRSGRACTQKRIGSVEPPSVDTLGRPKAIAMTRATLMKRLERLESRFVQANQEIELRIFLVSADGTRTEGERLKIRHCGVRRSRVR